MYLEISDKHGRDSIGRGSRNRTELALRFGYYCNTLGFTDVEVREWWAPFIDGEDHWHDYQLKVCFMVVTEE